MSKPQSYYATFLRHGESVGNLENHFQGQANFPLTNKGRAQARVTEHWQSENVTFDQRLTIPLLHAKETAEIVTAALNVPLETDTLWMEMDNGRMAGLCDEKIDWDTPKFLKNHVPVK